MMAKATKQQKQDKETPDESQSDGGVEVSEAQLPEAQAGGSAGPPSQIDILLDSTVLVSASLGEVEMPVRDALQLSAGSVVKLERKVGEPIDLYLRGVHFATGQLVVVADHLGVRINEIITPQSDQENQQ